MHSIRTMTLDYVGHCMDEMLSTGLLAVSITGCRYTVEKQLDKSCIRRLSVSS